MAWVSDCRIGDCFSLKDYVLSEYCRDVKKKDKRKKIMYSYGGTYNRLPRRQVMDPGKEDVKTRYKL